MLLVMEQTRMYNNLQVLAVIVKGRRLTEIDNYEIDMLSKHV